MYIILYIRALNRSQYRDIDCTTRVILYLYSVQIINTVMYAVHALRDMGSACAKSCIYIHTYIRTYSVRLYVRTWYWEVMTHAMM